MKKLITRNTAIITAIFIVTFSIMLTTNYFRVKNATPLQTEVLETLKEINDQNANNIELQNQIRELDLLARKAYFVNNQQLKLGIYILIGMLIVFVVSIRIYFTNLKHIPEKEITPIDDWVNKSKARKYIIWSISVFAIIALSFALFSMQFLTTKDTKVTNENEILDESELSNESEMSTEEPPEELPTDTIAQAELIISKITHNGFRGNNSNGTSAAKNVPTTWNLTSKKNIAWQVPVPRKGYNSPVINGNKIFFSGADEKARELFCYELSTGKQLWVLAATNISGSPAQVPATTDDTGLAASTVATNGEKVCAIFGTGDIICADTAGKRLWAKNLGVPDNHYGYSSSLLIYGNTIFVQYDNSNTKKIMALDVSTGNIRWSADRKEKITWSSPIIAFVENKPQLVLMGNPAITAYNPSNGTQLWRVTGFSGEVGASACSANGVIFGASEYSKMLAINGVDGSVIWEANDHLPEVSSPVATKDNVYVATSYGVAVCYDAQTGEVRKQHELNTEFYSSPIIVGGRIFLFSNDGKVFIFSADNEFKLITTFATGEKTFATPAFTDGKIVVKTEKSIYCVEAITK